MSSNEGNTDEEDAYRSRFLAWTGDDELHGRFNKKRKGRACDTCRRKKIKCDGTQTSDAACTNCATSKALCTYAEPSKRRAPIPPEYVEALKDRIRTLEDILTELFPNADIQAKDLSAEKLRRSLSRPRTSLVPDTVPDNQALSEELASDATPSTDDTIKEELGCHLSRDATAFHGQSSGAMFLAEVLNVKREPTDTEGPYSNTSTPTPPNAKLGAIATSYDKDHMGDILDGHSLRPQFRFPSEDLMDSLISLYFTKMSPLLPIFHQPTFYAQYHSKQHLYNSEFAILLLLVCAVSSRHSNDIRVLPAQVKHEPDVERWAQAGLDYYAQVHNLVNRPLTRLPLLSDLQKCTLGCLYIFGAKTASHGWSLSGYGIRLALEVGAHRGRFNAHTLENQLWNRAFWALICVDRLGSATNGRPCALHDEEIDLDLPVAVDDEYWDPNTPSDTWKQPSGKPAMAEYFRALLKLLEILTFALRTLYSSKKSKSMLGLVGSSWERRIVSEIDSAMNKWIDAIPDHLRWNPHQQNPTFFNQSATLMCFYYEIQILVHRPFILHAATFPMSRSSLCICTAAARASSHILALLLPNKAALPYLSTCAFSSCIVLLLNIWGAKKLGLPADPKRHMQDIFKCLSYLNAHSQRWWKAKLAWGVLNELVKLGNSPRHQLSHPSGALSARKRPHDFDGLVSGSGTIGTTSPGFADMLAYSRLQEYTTKNTSLLSTGRHGPSPPLSAPVFNWAPSSSVTQLDLPLVYFADGRGTMQSNPPNADLGSGRITILEEEDPSVNNGSEHALISSSGITEQPLPFMGSSMSSGLTRPPEQDAQESSLVDYDVAQPFAVDQEVYLGNDMLPLWATAPPSLENPTWSEFAQGFQVGEQLRFSDIFADGTS